MNPGEVYWIELTQASGHEQVGRRPAVILQDDEFGSGSPLLILVPLTTAERAARFAGTVTIEPTPENGLRKRSFALVFQIRAVDRANVGERLCEINRSELADIHLQLDRLLGRVNV